VPDLKRVLLDYDLSFLRVIAELWGVELRPSSQREAAEELTAQLLQPDLAAEAAALSPEARQALNSLLPTGRLPAAQFLREYGELRAMGPARRDREQPWRNQPSVSEQLWYRGFIARAFLAERDQAPQEFIFIPDDLRTRLPAAPADVPPALDLGLPVVPACPPAPSASLAPDDATTVLAYLQIAAVELAGAAILPRHRETISRFLRRPEGLELWIHLILRLGLAEGTPLKPEPTRARPFLEAPRAAQAMKLASAWRESREWNDLLHVPGLVFEGAAWRNDAYLARQAILKLLGEATPGQWWPVEAFVQAVRARQPDFQRPSGDYDSWYIRDAATKASLRGFAHWDQVDGALIRWLLEKPLYWLGIVELASAWAAPANPPEAGTARVFRVTPLGVRFLSPSPEAERREEADPAPPPVAVEADGTLKVPLAISRYDRFQIARVCNWLPLEAEAYPYRLAPASLARAAKQSIKVNHILAFLQKSLGEQALPPHLAGALQRWERAGSEAAVREMVTLKLKSPEMLENLLRMPGVKRYLGERLSPTLVEVRAAEVSRLRQALAELGILTD
jgi:hypothetical protein